MKRGIFIERDGILNQTLPGRALSSTPLALEDFRLTEVRPLLETLKREGFVLIATTNQPGISRGYQSRRELDRMHALMMRSFPLDDVVVCPHDATDHCPCHKPRPGLLVEASFRRRINLEHSFVLSNKWQDAEAARAVGATSMLIESPWIGDVHRDFLLPDVAAAVGKILQLRDLALALP